MELFEKSLNTLELPAVLELMAAEAVSDAAKERAGQVRPSPDKYEVLRRLRETSAAKRLIGVKGGPPFTGLRDVRGCLSRAELGGVLTIRELLDTAGVLRSARLVKGYASGEMKTDIDFLFDSLRVNRFLEDKITNSIASEDEIADAASAELASIRRLMRAAGARAREALQKIISSPSYAKALQEPIITMRAERYVVPVKAEHKGSVPGLVHDVSGSGATLFIEPMAAVKANNEMRELLAKEKQEIERILMELSANAAEFADDITRDFEILTTLDLIFAKAKLSFSMNAAEPVLSDGEMVLKRARHPLLPRDKAVPIDIELGGAFDTMVITGPNTGGKTVTLKTLGLASLMSACGLHVPADDGSTLPVFDKVLADIGDEQSIEQSLSTFSSHMTNIVRILEECGERTLLLFDELGAGTDPVEGAALAIAIIERARASGAVIAATTHYSELKVYATNEPGVQNASCEFDVDTLRPTYRLLIGIPGRSNAFAISERLGLPQDVIEDARARIGADSLSLEETLSKLERQRVLMERDRLEAEEKLREAHEGARRTQELQKEYKSKLEKADERARREARRVLEDARRTAEEVFSQLDDMRKQSEKDGDWRRVNEARAALRGKLNEAESELELSEEAEEQVKKSSRPIVPGDRVEILKMGVKADVLEVSPQPDRTLTLKAGILTVNVREDEVYLLDSETVESVKKYAEKSGVKLNTGRVSGEVDLRGMTSEEALAVMDNYLDGAVMNKLHTVTVIHGKGTGALRQAVTRSLKSNKLVKSFRLGRYGEGEDGVTVVELK